MARASFLRGRPFQPLTISGTPTATTNVDSSYLFAPTISGAAGKLTASISSGTLPGGLSLDTATGIISGVLTTVETKIAIVLTISDSFRSVSLSSFSISVAASSGIPIVAPGTNWTGAAKTGGIPSSFAAASLSNPTRDPITRTTAKPAIHWLVPSGQVLVAGADLVIGVDADAGGTFGGSLFGITHVVFNVEGTEQTVSTPSFYTDTDANGNSRTRWGYWIKVRNTDFSAGGYSGTEARIYATAVPNDTTMQNRVIGYDLVNAGLDDGNYPMFVLPRSSANDYSYTINASNSDTIGGTAFTTIKKALTQAAADGAERPLVKFMVTANYEAENLTNHVSGSKALCTFTHDTGVVATIQRAAAFTANSSASWPWTPGWDGIEFRGSGIVFDQRNWTSIVLGRPSWFNGCKFTNSNGAGRDTTYWNGGYGGGYNGTGSLMCWMDNVYSEYVSGVFLNNYYSIGCQVKQTAGSCFTGNAYVYNTYVRDYTNSYYSNVQNRLSITYTDPGGHTTATIAKSTGAGVAGNLVLSVDGSTTNIAIGSNGSETNPTVQDVVNAINAHGAGWSAAVLNSAGAWNASFIGPISVWTFSATSVYNTTVNLQASPDPHGEWWQGYGPSSSWQSPPARENVILRNNVLRDSPDDPWIKTDDASNGDQSQDHIVKGNIVLGAGAITYWGGAASGANSMSHYVLENNTFENQFARVESVAGDQVYSSYRNNIAGPAYTDGGTTYLNSTPWVNNFYIVHAGDGTTMTGGSNSGNTSYTGGFSALLTSYSTGDARPVAAGVVLGTQFAKVNTYDRFGTAYSATDVAGAVSKNTASFTAWPF